MFSLEPREVEQLLFRPSHMYHYRVLVQVSQPLKEGEGEIPATGVSVVPLCSSGCTGSSIFQIYTSLKLGGLDG